MEISFGGDGERLQQAFPEDGVLDVLLVFEDEAGDDGTEQCRGGQLDACGRLEAVEDTLEVGIDVDGCQSGVACLVVACQLSSPLSFAREYSRASCLPSALGSFFAAGAVRFFLSEASCLGLMCPNRLVCGVCRAVLRSYS